MTNTKQKKPTHPSKLRP